MVYDNTKHNYTEIRLSILFNSSITVNTCNGTPKPCPSSPYYECHQQPIKCRSFDLLLQITYYNCGNGTSKVNIMIHNDPMLFCY